MRSADSVGAASPAGEDAPASIVVGYRDGVTVLGLVGEHGMSTADEVAFNIAEQVVHGRGIVVSLTETELIDSAIVNTLFRGDREQVTRGRRLVVHGGGDAVQRTFDLTGVSERLLCCDSLEEAIAFASQNCL